MKDAATNDVLGLMLAATRPEFFVDEQQNLLSYYRSSPERIIDALDTMRRRAGNATEQYASNVITFAAALAPHFRNVSGVQVAAAREHLDILCETISPAITTHGEMNRFAAMRGDWGVRPGPPTGFRSLANILQGYRQ